MLPALQLSELAWKEWDNAQLLLWTSSIVLPFNFFVLFFFVFCFFLIGTKVYQTQSSGPEKLHLHTEHRYWTHHQNMQMLLKQTASTVTLTQCGFNLLNAFSVVRKAVGTRENFVYVRVREQGRSSIVPAKLCMSSSFYFYFLFID